MERESYRSYLPSFEEAEVARSRSKDQWQMHFMTIGVWEHDRSVVEAVVVEASTLRLIVFDGCWRLQIHIRISSLS